MNITLFKNTQTITDLANVYDQTTRRFITNFFWFALNHTDIEKDENLLKHFKFLISWIIWEGVENAITNHSVVGDNDVLLLLRFMNGLLKPSEKLTTDNFMATDDKEIIEALNRGVNRMLTDIIESQDKYTLTEKQKQEMIKTIKSYKLEINETGSIKGA